MQVTGWTEGIFRSVAVALIARTKVRWYAIVGADGIRWTATPPTATTLDLRYSKEAGFKLSPRDTQQSTLIVRISVDHALGTIIGHGGSFSTAIGA